LLIADISGFTEYLAAVELEHSLDILAWLIDGMTGQLRGVWEVIEVEGDAVFGHAPDGVLDGSDLVATMDALYGSFADRRAEIERRTTCPCRACRSVPNLDLKVVVHAGEYGRQTMGTARKIVGPSVILVHRLLKNAIVERTGIRAYGFVTEEALAALSLDGSVDGIRHEEGYDVGTARGIVIDIGARWREREARRAIAVGTDQAIATFDLDTSETPAVAWRCLTTPHALARWMADQVEEERTGPRGTGTVLHCVHGKRRFAAEIVDWKPHRYFTWRIAMRGSPSMLSTVELSPGPDGGTRISYRVAAAGRGPARAMARMMAPMLRSSMRKTGELLSQTLTEMGSGQG
jgi:uncharacterized protein YndB with AHSA1/START domain